MSSVMRTTEISPPGPWIIVDIPGFYRIESGETGAFVCNIAKGQDYAAQTASLIAATPHLFEAAVISIEDYGHHLVPAMNLLKIAVQEARGHDGHWPSTRTSADSL